MEANVTIQTPRSLTSEEYRKRVAAARARAGEL
jgi:hypothetical protein